MRRMIEKQSHDFQKYILTINMHQSNFSCMRVLALLLLQSRLKRPNIQISTLMESEGGDLIILTGTVVETPRATNKTARYPQGPFCV